MKIKDLAHHEVKNAVVDNKGNVLCPNCKKELANVTKYGMIRNCDNCGDKKYESYGMAMIDEPWGRKSY